MVKVVCWVGALVALTVVAVCAPESTSVLEEEGGTDSEGAQLLRLNEVIHRFVDACAPSKQLLSGRGSQEVGMHAERGCVLH